MGDERWMGAMLSHTRWLVGGLLLTHVLGQGAMAAEDDPAPPVKPASALVQLVRLHQRMMGHVVDAWGEVGADARMSQVISPAVAGQVQALHVVAGQAVEQGECMLTFVTAPEIRQVWQQALNALRFANAEQKRVDVLLTEQLATTSQRDAAERAVHDATQAVEALQAQGADRPSQRICAPFGGWVQQVAVSNGQRVPAASTLLVLVPNQPGNVVLQVDPLDAAQIKAGSSVELDDMNSTGRAQGKVWQVAGAINPQTRMRDVTVRIPAGSFAPGQRVHAHILENPRLVLVVPRSAVLADADGSYLFQVENGRAHRVTVKTGNESDGWLEVSGHFNLGSPVVVSGNYELDDGMAVRGDGR